MKSPILPIRKFLFPVLSFVAVTRGVSNLENRGDYPPGFWSELKNQKSHPWRRIHLVSISRMEPGSWEK